MINARFQCRPSQPIDLWNRPPFVLLQSFFGWASIIIIRQSKIFLVEVHLYVYVWLCVFSVVFQPELKLCLCVCVCGPQSKSLNCVWELVLGLWGLQCPGRNEVNCLDSVWHILGTAWHSTALRTPKCNKSRAMRPKGFRSGNFALQMTSSWDCTTQTCTQWSVYADMLICTACMCFISSSAQHLILHQTVSTLLGFTVLRSQVTNDRRASSQHLAPPHHQPNLGFLNVTNPFRKSALSL